MICPKCSGKTRVVDTDKLEDGRIVRRRRACKVCGHRFTTRELPTEMVSTPTERGLLDALTILHDTASAFALHMLAHGHVPPYSSYTPDDQLAPLALITRELVEAINITKTFMRPDLTR